VLLASGMVASQQAISPELQALVDTERAFARTATVKGLRDSFLDYFADDSIALVPAPESATARLRAQPSQPFSALEITWEPRLGDVAGSNDIGWLTGPSTIVDHTAAPPAPRFGNYLSVWRRQPDGRWRVYIDVGVNVPELPQFNPGFTRLPSGTRYEGSDSKDAATRALREADQSLNDRIATAGFGAFRGPGDCGLTPASAWSEPDRRSGGHSRVGGDRRHGDVRDLDHGRSRTIRRSRVQLRHLCGNRACRTARRLRSHVDTGRQWRLVRRR